MPCFLSSYLHQIDHDVEDSYSDVELHKSFLMTLWGQYNECKLNRGALYTRLLRTVLCSLVGMRYLSSATSRVYNHGH